jgi:phosphate-selective porin OprO/OprP
MRTRFDTRLGLLAAALVVVLAAAPPSRGQDPDVKELLRRLEQVEKQNRELQRQLDQLKQATEQQRSQQEIRPTQAVEPLPNTQTIAPPGSLVAPSVQGPAAGGVLIPGGAAATPMDSAAGAPGRPGNAIFNPSPNPGGGGIAAGSFPYATNPSASLPGYAAGWSEGDGFFLKSSDNSFIMRVTGQVQADTRLYDIEHDTTDIDSFLVRRARLGVEGTVFSNWEYRLLPDFSNSQSNTVDVATPRILDAYVNAHYWDAFQVEAGKFKQPFSYEQLIQDRFIPTVERSLIDQLVPARDVGVMVHGEKLFADRFDYAVSIFNGEINDDYDQNKGKDMAARIVVRPLNDETLPLWARGLQAGVSYAFGNDKEPISNTTPNVLRTPDQVVFLQFNSGVRADGPRTRVSPEVAYFYDQFGFAAQYFYGQQKFLPSATAPTTITVPQSGFYVMSSYVLTGETRTTYSQAVIPFNNFDPRYPFLKPGAWEIIARVSELRYGDAIFDTFKVGKTTFGPLVNPTLWSQGATEFDIGLNWFLNRYIRVEVAYEHDWFLQPVQLGVGKDGRLKEQDSVITRLQLAF